MENKLLKQKKQNNIISKPLPEEIFKYIKIITNNYRKNSTGYEIIFIQIENQ